MRSEKTESAHQMDTTTRVPGLSIVIDDFDLAKESSNANDGSHHMPEVSLYQPQHMRPYSRQSSDASIKKILEEAEHRKHEFWKLIDEHKEVIENLKKIEQLEHNGNICKISPTPVSS